MPFSTTPHTLHLHWAQASRPAQRITKWANLHMQSLRRWGVKQRALLSRDSFAISPFYCPGIWLYKCILSNLWIMKRFIPIYTDCCTTEGDCIVLSSDSLEKPHWWTLYLVYTCMFGKVKTCCALHTGIWTVHPPGLVCLCLKLNLGINVSHIQKKQKYLIPYLIP